MAMNEFQKIFRDTMYKITDNIQFINAEYLFARTDEVRQEIINGINNNILKSEDDVSELTKKMSPCYDILKAKGLI